MSRNQTQRERPQPPDAQTFTRIEPRPTPEIKTRLAPRRMMPDAFKDLPFSNSAPQRGTRGGRAGSQAPRARKWKPGDWACLSRECRQELKHWGDLLPRNVQIAQLDTGTKGPIARVVNPAQVSTGSAPGGGWWILQSHLEGLN